MIQQAQMLAPGYLVSYICGAKPIRLQEYDPELSSHTAHVQVIVHVFSLTHPIFHNQTSVLKNCQVSVSEKDIAHSKNSKALLRSVRAMCKYGVGAYPYT